jgi:branched-chain amino acid transport system permease protein
MQSVTLRIPVNRLAQTRYLVAALGVAALLAAPMFLGSFNLFLLTSACFLATFTITWDFFTGLTGYFSFAHMFIVALGGYSSALLNGEMGVSLTVSILIGTLIAGIAGTVVIGGISLRLTGIYFAALTFILPEIGQRIIIVFSDTTGGLSGYIFISPLAPALADFVPLDFSNGVMLAYFSIANFLIILAVLVVLAKSKLGTILRAVRQDELLLSSLGISPTKFKIAGFGLIALLTGFTGAVWSHFLVALTPSTQLSVNTMIDIVIAATVGGIGTIVGPALGMGLLQFVEQALINMQGDIYPEDAFIDIVEYQRAITISIALVFLYRYPQGIYPPLKAQFDKVDSKISERFGNKND